MLTISVAIFQNSLTSKRCYLTSEDDLAINPMFEQLISRTIENIPDRIGYLQRFTS